MTNGFQAQKSQNKFQKENKSTAEKNEENCPLLFQSALLQRDTKELQIHNEGGYFLFVFPPFMKEPHHSLYVCHVAILDLVDPCATVV